MPSSQLTFFKQAVDAGQTYLQASVRARDAQYRFLALAYLAYREGQRHPKQFAKRIEERVGRQPTRPEQKRCFLLLLHALLGSEDDLQPNTLPALSKLTAALEEIDRVFSDAQPSPEDIIDFIRDAGGVGGLYDLARMANADPNQAKHETSRVVDARPGEIPLPALGGIVTKVGKGYRLRLPDREPGKYLVRLRVDQGGFVQAMLDPNATDMDAA